MTLFPLSIAVGVLLWYKDTDFLANSYLTLAILLFSTLALRVLSNAIQLIRVRSWAVSSIFVIISALCFHIYDWQPVTALGSLLFLGYTTGLLASYQSPRPQVSTFIAAISLALLTMLMPQLLWLAPICLLSSLTTLRTFTPRTLFAIAFGLLLSYEAFFCWHICNGTLIASLQYFSQEICNYSIPSMPCNLSFDTIVQHHVLSSSHMYMLQLFIFGIIGIIHFIRTSFNDKIRTRMHYITIIMHWPVLFLLITLTHGYEPLLMSMTALYSSIVLAHYFVFSKGWVANTLFLIFIISCFCLTLPLF